jgi:hypothetical protein
MANENQTPTTETQSSWESVNVIISKIKWFFQKSQSNW